jgi:CheY-like chemotaxis protein
MQTAAPAGAPLVLVVDDHEDNRDVAVQALGLAGFRVDTAADGAECLHKAARLRPVVIVMDLEMPHMDGWEATAALKASPELREICVIVVSAHAMAADRARAVEAGCDAFLVKPVNPVILVAAVKAAVSKAIGGPDEPGAGQPEA